MKKVGYLDSRRLRVGGMPQWPLAPAVLIPGTWEAYGIFEEFFGSEGLAVISATGWVLGQTNSLMSIEDLPGGVVNLANQAAAVDNDTAQLTLGDGAGGAFLPAPGKDIWFEARVKTIKVGDNPSFFVGLQDPSATEYIGDGPGCARVNNHLAFLITDTGAVAAPNWFFEGDKAGVPDTNDLLIAQVPGAWHTFGFHVHGEDATGLLPGQVDVYYDGVLIPEGKVLAAHIPVTYLMPAIFFKAGDASLESISVDYIMCVQKR